MSTVPRADDLARLDLRTVQRLTVMRAAVFYGVQLRAAAYDKHGKPVDVCGERSRIPDRVCAADVHPVAAHENFKTSRSAGARPRTSCSGSRADRRSAPRARNSPLGCAEPCL